jgi:hypothetical protein
MYGLILILSTAYAWHVLQQRCVLHDELMHQSIEVKPEPKVPNYTMSMSMITPGKYIVVSRLHVSAGVVNDGWRRCSQRIQVHGAEHCVDIDGHASSPGLECFYVRQRFSVANQKTLGCRTV